MGSAEDATYPVHRRRVPAFYLDTKEVTVAEFIQVWPTFQFPDNLPAPPGNFPMAGISWDDAAAHAERIGKRLLDETEYEYAATDLGRRKSSRNQQFAGWSFEPAGQPKSDCLAIDEQPPIYGLCSNVAEWTSSWRSLYPGQTTPGRPLLDPMERVVRGGPRSVILGVPDDQAAKWQPYERVAVAVPMVHPGLGFRCARSPKARIRPEDFITLLP